VKVVQDCWLPDAGWRRSPADSAGIDAQLVLAFGARTVLEQGEPLAQLRERHPCARIVGCSTAGEICGTRVLDGSLVATAVRFDRARVREHFERPDGPADVAASARRLADALSEPDLRHVFVLSDGLKVNGSALVEGLGAAGAPGVSVTGGLSGDASRFQRTLVVSDGEAREEGIVGVGLYGDGLEVGYGSRGGWEPFGPRRLVTRSRENLLLELDGEAALEVYRRYLGPEADGLPASGLLFPLSIELPGESRPVVRTILAIDEAAGGLVFAGNVPQGVPSRLMRARLDGLIDGAIGAAAACTEAGDAAPELAILVSCVGRKLVMRQRTEEEVEGVAAKLGAGTNLTGFYSYGEISAFDRRSALRFHNQTMTVTTFAEAA